MSYRNNHHSRNPEFEKSKIIFQFTLMLVAAVIGGICFSNFLGDEAIAKLSQQIYNHFHGVLPLNSAFTYLISSFLQIAISDFICITIILVFSFSFINYTVSDVLLVFAGFKYGINSSLIVLSKITVVGLGNSLSYLLIRGVLIAVLLIYTCKMAIYSLEIRRFSANDGRIIFNTTVILSMLTLTVTTTLVTILFNFIYCIFIYIF